MGQNVEDNRLWGGWAPTDAATIKLLYLRQREHDRRGKDCKSQKSRKSVAGSCLHLWNLNNTTALENLSDNSKRPANMEGENYPGPHP